MAQSHEAVMAPRVTIKRYMKPLLLVVALAALAAISIKSWRMYSVAQPVLADIGALKIMAAAKPEDRTLADVGRLLSKTRSDTSAFRIEAAPLLPFARYLGWVPVYGPDLVAAGPLLDMAVDMTAAADDTLVALTPIVPLVQDKHSLNPLLPGQLAAARPRLESAQQAITRASASWARVSLDELSPGLRAQLQPVGPLLPLINFTASLAISADDLSSALVPLVVNRQGAGAPAATIARQLADARPQLEIARTSLARASEVWSHVSPTDLPASLRGSLQQVADMLPLARDSVDLGMALPGLLGVGQPHEYLVIAQNPDELRATGGFFSSVGVVTFDAGRPTISRLQDATNVDDVANQVYPDPPVALLQYMDIEMWLFRDAGWSPDFPTSARTASDLYKLGQGRAITDVIAFDPVALQLLLKATGPLSVDGSPTPVTADNVVDYMRQRYDLVGKSSESFIGPLSKALFARMFEHPDSLDLLALLRTARQALDGGHLLFAVHDQTAAGIFARYGWDGSVQPGLNDYLMVVDSNIGYNKVTPNIREAVDYSVDLGNPAAPTATLQIEYTNSVSASGECDQFDTSSKSYKDWMVGCYRDYLRVLTPDGGKLIDANTQPVPAAMTWAGVADDGQVTTSKAEGNTTAFSTFLVVPVGAKHTTILRYALPPKVLVQEGRIWRYRLAIQKQAGRGFVPYSVRVLLPPNATLAATSTPPSERQGQTLIFKINDLRTQTIELSFQSP